MDQPPDLEKLFEHRGGFALAIAKLAAYAVIVIKRRSGPSKNGRAVAKLDKMELVRSALARLVEMESLTDGEAIYLQLRRHIDNEVHTLQKKKPGPLVVPIAVGTPAEDDVAIADPEDCNAVDPADEAERSAEDDFYRDLLNKLQKQHKPTSPESRLIGFIMQGKTDRAELAKLLGITPEQYDAMLKRVSRAAQALKETALRGMTA